MSVSFGPTPAELLFSLDPDSVSQFSGSDDYADSTAAISLSTQAVTGYGNALQLAGSGGNDGIAIRLALDELPFKGTERSVLFQIHTHNINDPAGASAGICFMADDSGSFHGLCVLGMASGGTNTFACKIENGSRVNGNNGTNWGSQGALTMIECAGRKLSGSPPFLTMAQGGWDQGSLITGEIHRTGTTRGGMIDMDGGGALGSTWNSLACRKWGLCMYGQSGTNLPVTWDILGLKIWARY